MSTRKPVKRGRRVPRPGVRTLNAEQTVAQTATGLFDFFCAPKSPLREALLGDDNGAQEDDNDNHDPDTLDTEGESL